MRESAYDALSWNGIEPRVTRVKIAHRPAIPGGRISEIRHFATSNQDLRRPRRAINAVAMENEASAVGESQTPANPPSAKSDSLSVMPAKPQSDASTELQAFNAIVSALQGVREDVRPRLIKTVFTFLGYSDISLAGPKSADTEPAHRSATAKTSGFSEDRDISAKEFLFQKKPTTDIERIACLAYYLAHYRTTPHFKTLDLSKLNTEAAQIKLANAANAVDNATSAGLLVSAGKGSKQLSALGELYVQNLPDREAAKAAIAHVKPRRKNRRQNENGEKKE